MTQESTIYAVTGAAGFLGSNICRALVAGGKRVRALVLPEEPGVDKLPQQVRIVRGDVCRPTSLRPLFETDDERLIVIHCASIVTVNPEYSQKVWDVNVRGTENIIDLCHLSPSCIKLVYVSSTGCIPELKHGRKITEVSSFNPREFRDCYSQTKAAATQAVLEAARRGLDACVIHPAGIMGPDDYAVGHCTDTLAQIINGRMKAGIMGTFNLVDVRDLAAAIIAAAHRGRSGECYILANEAVSFPRFVRIVSNASGKGGVKFFIPGFMAYLMAWFMERKARKTGKKPLMSTFAVYNLVRNNTFDSSKAQRELGFYPRPYRETIADQVAWMKSINLI